MSNVWQEIHVFQFSPNGASGTTLTYLSTLPALLTLEQMRRTLPYLVVHFPLTNYCLFRIFNPSRSEFFSFHFGIPGHPLFVSCQFHPEFKSNPIASHLLFRNFMGASLKNKSKKSTWQLENEKLKFPTRGDDCCHRDTKNVF